MPSPRPVVNIIGAALPTRHGIWSDIIKLRSGALGKGVITFKDKNRQSHANSETHKSLGDNVGDYGGPELLSPPQKLTCQTARLAWA